MKRRKIVKIDKELCNGCGLCIKACHEGALQLVNGKATLVSDSYCDGLGDCLPECPTGAITLEERDAAAFDEEAVKKHLNSNNPPAVLACGCPGTHARTVRTKAVPAVEQRPVTPAKSELFQWPCQLKLAPPNAPYFDNARLLIAADCTAYAYANFHQDFMRNKVTLIGCPKLDNTDYSDNLTEILKLHEIKSITVLKMEVPCCSGIESAVKKALINSGKTIPWSVVTIGTDGSIVEE